MTYFNQFKNATRKTKRLLVLFALLFGFSANAATHIVSATPVDPSTLDDGAQVVMYHNGTGKLVGYQDGKEVTKDKDSKEITDAYVFTVTKDGNKIALQNGAGYVPQVTGSNRVFSVNFSFSWQTSVTSSSYFNVNYNSASDVARLYIEYTPWWGTTYKGYMSRTNDRMSAKQDPSDTETDDADWTFYRYDDGTGGYGTAPTKHNQLKAWTDNAGYQEVGYIGLGNKNQVLASACVNYSAAQIPTIAYRLFGHTEYLSAVGVYARKRDTGQDYNSDKSAYGSFENTFAHIFDYRNPEKNCGAIFLGFTYDVPKQFAPATFTSNVSLDAGEYVIYLVANTKTAEEIGGLDQLPLIGGSRNNFTRVGGVIETVTCGTTTYKINTVNNYSKDGGGRVIVPQFKLLYAPKYGKFPSSEEYSKYYRIPAITRASDGTLVALSDARKNHIHDVSNNIDIVSRRSSDNGKTWSDYIVIFQGSEDGGAGCKYWNGYGDGAVASFSNGTVIATAIHGFGLSGGTSDAASDVVWKVSRDNGKSWSSEFVMNKDLYDGYRGNISPGNICVGKEGHLKGKALVGLRTSTSPNNGYSVSEKMNRIYCMTYDPNTNEWTNVTVSGSGLKFIKDGSASLDETQFVQMGENEYLMSARYFGAGSRKFYRLTFTSATTATVTEVSQSGMTLAGACNGDLINYTTANQGTYVIHTIPKDWTYDADNARSSLTAYYTNATTSGNLTWTRSLDLFDPFDNTSGGEKKSGIGALDESAQYSSLSMQEDGTIAVLMEAYPYAIRHMDGDRNNNTAATHWGDWVMGQYYINLRIGDIIPNAVQPAAQVIDAPVISPKSSTYDSYVTTDRPEITISHKNYVNHSDLYNETDAKVNTLYDFEFFDAEGVLQKEASIGNFQTESQSFTWEQVWTALGYDSDPADMKKGWYLRVSAYCVSAADQLVISKKDVKIYTFANPVRNIKVIGLPTSGASKTELSTQGNTVGSDVWLTVGVGQEVHLNAPALYPFTFKGFYYKYKMNGSTNEQVKLSQKLPDNYNEVSGMQHQITFTVPSVAALADNHKDGDVAGLVIYAVYEVEAGFSTRVNTQYNNGLVGGKYESHHSYWTPNTDTEHVERIQGAVGGTPLAKNLVIPAAANQNNTHIGGTGNADKGGLTYPKALNYGLDAYVTLVPDSRAAKYLNAIIRVKKGDAYLPNYYVVNGANQALYGNITSAFNGCLGVVNWYAHSGGEFYPKAVGMKTYEVGSKPKATSARRSIVEGGANGAWYKVDSDISFAGICEKAETFDGVVTVEIYLVNGDVTSVNELSNSNYYITKVSHTIVKDPDISTGVEDVDAEKTVAGVTYYNLLGVSSDRPFEGVNVVVTTYTDGTKSSKKIVK
ncbi:MAG: sialidase family protein [Sodaliphilus sp.]|nr:sialidase family protein [Sodaliphilus sp.]